MRLARTQLESEIHRRSGIRSLDRASAVGGAPYPVADVTRSKNRPAQHVRHSTPVTDV